jgi:hypothetical protein
VTKVGLGRLKWTWATMVGLGRLKWDLGDYGGTWVTSGTWATMVGLGWDIQHKQMTGTRRVLVTSVSRDAALGMCVLQINGSIPSWGDRDYDTRDR